MSRYIDADALLNKLPDDLPYKASVKRVVMQAPTADVVEVVRCKNCIFWTGGNYSANCIADGLKTRYENEYCSRGERSESDGENDT